MSTVFFHEMTQVLANCVLLVALVLSAQKDVVMSILCEPMNSSIWFDIMNLGWFIVYNKGSQVRNSKIRCTSVPEDCFNLSKQCI